MNHIIRYEPINVLNDINKLFEQTFFPQHRNSDNSNLETPQWIPAVDVKEDQHAFTIKVDLPGIDKKDIMISMEDGVLSVQGERAAEKKEDHDNYYRVERVSGKFYRRFSLPETANAEKIEAHMVKGVLEIHIPKREVSKLKSIEIKGED